MPFHNWSLVEAGIFHDFQNVWIAEIRNALNQGILPSGYYAMSEQHAGRYIADVLTLSGDRSNGEPPEVMTGGVALAEAPPQVRRKLVISPSAKLRRKTLTIRHVSGHRIVALLEIVSPANKDRREHVQAFVDKLEDALLHGIHVLALDLFPPGRHDPNGMHSALCERLGAPPDCPPVNEPLTLASYIAEPPYIAYLEYLATGDILPEMPLFLDPSHYINVPLERSYQTAWAGTPEYWRNVLEPKDDE